jgi:hypothetical protein
LLITPLLPELMVSLLVSSAFLHAVVAAAAARINRVTKALLRFPFMISLHQTRLPTPHVGASAHNWKMQQEIYLSQVCRLLLAGHAPLAFVRGRRMQPHRGKS